MPETAKTPESLRALFVVVPITTRSAADYAQALYPELRAHADAWQADMRAALRAIEEAR